MIPSPILPWAPVTSSNCRTLSSPHHPGQSLRFNVVGLDISVCGFDESVLRNWFLAHSVLWTGHPQAGSTYLAIALQPCGICNQADSLILVSLLGLYYFLVFSRHLADSCNAIRAVTLDGPPNTGLHQMRHPKGKGQPATLAKSRTIQSSIRSYINRALVPFREEIKSITRSRSRVSGMT